MTEVSESAEPLGPLLNDDGSCFDGLEAIGEKLNILSDEDRKTYRNANAVAIAGVTAQSLLIIAGPGAGKSHLFISRIEHWLAEDSERSIYVATFVRKLVTDLNVDIEKRLSEADQQRVQASTLHTLARGILERAQGTSDCSFGKFIRIIDGYWAPIIWQDILAFHPGLDPSLFTMKALDSQFHTEQLTDDDDWAALRATHQTICQFFNAVGFSYLIKLSQQAIEERPELVEHRLWIIDEYQDFNRSEDHLIRTLVAAVDGVVLAGDDEQALYQKLKASDPDIIIGYYNDPAFVKAMLPFCSRCSFHICRAASAFMEAHREDTAIEKIYLPLVVDEEAERLQVVATASPTGAVDYVRMFMEDRADEYASYLEKRNEGEDTDPFLLILSPSGSLTLTKASDADRELEELIGQYAEQPVRRSPAYLRIVSYSTAGWYETDNFALRKVLHYEDVSILDVHELIAQAIENSWPLAEAVSESRPEILDKARQVAGLIDEAEGDEVRIGVMVSSGPAVMV